MKKLILLFACVSLFVSCDVDDDPNLVLVPAEVVDIDLPDSFEQGKSYLLEVSYLLPNACHTPSGLQVTRGSETGEERRDIYVVGVAAVEEGFDCTLPANNLETYGSFRIIIDEDDPFTFYLWTGVDENDEAIYTQVVVPVGATQTPVEN
jgi:hypothetical protein